MSNCLLCEYAELCMTIYGEEYIECTLKNEKNPNCEKCKEKKL